MPPINVASAESITLLSNSIAIFIAKKLIKPFTIKGIEISVAECAGMSGIIADGLSPNTTLTVFDGSDSPSS